MPLLNIPAWPFEPNWTSSVTEILEWMTDVMTSPTGSEQRRSLRYFPRRTFEYSAAIVGRERTLFDNMVVTYGAQRWYLPLWHDVSLLSGPVAAGSTALPCSDAMDSRLRPGSIAVMVNDSVFEQDLVEIASISSSEIQLVAGTTRAWPIGTRIYPALVAKLTDQPVATKRSDALITTELRFQVVEATPDPLSTDTGLPDSYRGFSVINVPPDEAKQLQAGHERLLLDLDNKFSIPIWVDTADRTFTYQQYAWVLEGRSQHIEFEGLAQHLRGRAIPVWMPTFMDDLRLAAPISAGASTILVERCGFTLAGGPRPDREDIVIELADERLYRRITDSAVDSEGREILVLDAPIASEIQLTAPVRICFMTLMRLNHDSIQIEHMTDNTGVSTVLATFRSAPDTRTADAAIFP